MPYSQTFIRCRLRAVHPFDDLADEIGMSLDRGDVRKPLRVILPRADALLMMDQLRAYLAADTPSATPSENDSETDAVVSALAALTDRVRTLEERAGPKAASPFSFGDGGNMRTSPDGSVFVYAPTLSKSSTVEQSIAHETAKPVPTASELYDEITRITTEPADGLLARIDVLETAVTSLQTSVAALSDDVSNIRTSESGLNCRLVTLEGQLAVLQAEVDGLEAATEELRGRTAEFAELNRILADHPVTGRRSTQP